MMAHGGWVAGLKSGMDRKIFEFSRSSDHSQGCSLIPSDKTPRLTTPFPAPAASNADASGGSQDPSLQNMRT